MKIQCSIAVEKLKIVTDLKIIHLELLILIMLASL